MQRISFSSAFNRPNHAFLLRNPTSPRFALQSARCLSTIKEKIKIDLKESLKAKDKLQTTVIKSLSSDFINAEKSPPAEQPKSEGDYIKILRKAVQRRMDSIQQYKDGGRPDLADKESAELEILERYLPVSLSPEQLEDKVSQLIAQLKVESVKGIGAVMSRCQDLVDSGAASKKDISDIVKRLLK